MNATVPPPKIGPIPGPRGLKAVLQAVLFLGLILSLYRQNWLNAALILGIILLTLVPGAAGRRFNVYIPPEFEVMAILMIFFSLFLGELHGYYTKYWWWDLVLHGSSGLLFGLLGFVLVYVLNQDAYVPMHLDHFFVALFSFAFAVTMGAMWEVFEFTMDAALGLNMQKSGLVDTMWDLIINAIGALAMAIMGYSYMSTDTDSFIAKWIAKFVDGNPRIFRRG